VELEAVPRLAVAAAERDATDGVVRVTTERFSTEAGGVAACALKLAALV
jgi:hypothetical protein